MYLLVTVGAQQVSSLRVHHSIKLKAYPNPVSDVLTVEREIQGDYQILNLLGQQVLNGQAASRIDVSTLLERDPLSIFVIN